jgi:hypothetical protein
VLHAVLTLAAEKAEPNKTAFYICGGALVIWALAVATVGIRNERFAEAKRTGRTVIAISALLMLATMASAVLTG